MRPAPSTATNAGKTPAGTATAWPALELVVALPEVLAELRGEDQKARRLKRKKGTYLVEPEAFVVDPPVVGPVLAGVLAPVAPGLEAGPVGVVPLVELPGVPVYKPS
jgi:hypothetical protein